MSAVYRAEDLTLERKVALKLMSDELSADERFRERFRAEWRLAASLDHPNVIPIHEAGESDGTLFIAMRYVEGTDLKELLKEEGALEPGRALAFLSQAAAGLDQAHKRGLVHRDIKPSNILVARDDEEEHVYLADFGLTKPASSEDEARISITLSGSFDYVSPEQIAEGTTEASSDIYSLGALFYECLTGQVPYPHEQEFQVLWAHIDEPPPKPSQANPNLPHELDPVIATAMAKEPEERYASAAELVDAAQAALPTRRFSRRTLLGLAALIAVAIAVPAVLLTGSGEEPVVGEDWTRAPHNQTAFGFSEATHAYSVGAWQSGLVAVGSDGEQFGIDEDVDVDGAVWTSPDGVTWTRVLDDELGGPGDQYTNAVIEGPSGLIVVGFEGDGEKFKAAVWRSPDGTSWKRVPGNEEAFASSWMQDFAAGGPGFVAVGQDLRSGVSMGAWTSTDGVSWSRVPDDPQAFGPRIQTEDAAIWTWRITAAEDGRVVAVGSETLGLGSSVAAAWLSPDGLSWTRAPHDAAAFGNGSTNNTLDDVVAAGPGFVSVGAETDGNEYGEGPLPWTLGLPAPPKMQALIVTSEDGLVWNRVPPDRLPEGRENVFLRSITTRGSGLVAVGWRRHEPGVVDGDTDPVAWVSEDGETWTEAADPDGALTQPGGQLIEDVIEHDSRLVALGLDGDSRGFVTAVWTSP